MNDFEYAARPHKESPLFADKQAPEAVYSVQNRAVCVGIHSIASLFLSYCAMMTYFGAAHSLSRFYSRAIVYDLQA